MSEIIFDPELIRRYDKAGPRYTSYPTAVQFDDGFDQSHYKDYAIQSNSDASPLSLYFHLPFCDTVCFYCACNKVITNNRKKAIPYLRHLYTEMALQATLFDPERSVSQLHWGGGTPTFLNHEQMRDLMDETRQFFNLLDDDSGEYSIEIDPREANTATVNLLRELGFNRLSLGVQDFNPEVQKAVNRIQSIAETQEVVQAARTAGFHSISIDLMYGLPLQNTSRFAQTLDQVISMSPDRLSIFNYAHLPEMFKVQRQINETQLPSAETKLAILQLCVQRLTDEGYVYIGMDHFARPNDELAIAQQNGSLYRNFQGYSTQAECDLLAMGITAISRIGNSYSQNVRQLDQYSEKMESGQLPIFRGLALNHDDILRRHIISQLMCHFELNISVIEKRYAIKFIEYFASEQTDLQKLEHDNLIQYAADRIMVKPAGKFLIRNICMVFDRYLRNSEKRHFSRVI